MKVCSLGFRFEIDTFDFFPKGISEMLGFSFKRLPRGARFERSLRYAGARDAEIAGKKATEGKRGRRVRCGMVRYAGAGGRCRNSMGGGYRGGARFERTLRYARPRRCRNSMGGGYGQKEKRGRGAGDVEIAWEEATEGGARSVRYTVGLQMQKIAEIAWEEAKDGERGRMVRKVRWC